MKKGRDIKPKKVRYRVTCACGHVDTDDSRPAMQHKHETMIAMGFWAKRYKGIGLVYTKNEKLDKCPGNHTKK